LSFHPEDVIISLINIIVLFILLRLILWKHVIRFLAEREKRVQDEMDNADKRRLEAENLHTEYKEKLDGIEERGQELIRESQQKANEQADKILSETRDKAKDMIDEAESRIAYEKEQALEESREEITQLATDMASRILRREVVSSDNSNVVDEFFKD